MNAIIFSKDRPAQLDLLLRSMQKYAPEIYKEAIVQLAGWNKGYDLVREYHRDIDYGLDSDNGSFQSTLLKKIYEWDDETVFFMDDMCFVRPFNLMKVRLYLKNKNFLMMTIWF